MDHSGRYVVSYIPVEVGIYNVRVNWNGREIAGKLIHVLSSRYLVSSGKKFVSHTPKTKPLLTECNSGRDVVMQITNQRLICSFHESWISIAESPFHPKVVHAGKVRAVDGWQSIIDANNHMQLELNQIKRIELDCIEAGTHKIILENNGRCRERRKKSALNIWKDSFAFRLFAAIRKKWASTKLSFCCFIQVPGR